MGSEEKEIAPTPFSLYLPVDLEKSVEVNGERLICGIISTEDVDLDGERIVEELANYNPMIEQMGKNLKSALADQVDWDRFSTQQGWLKWEHTPEPEAIIGWPEHIEKSVIYNDPATGMKKSGTAMWGQLFPERAGNRKADAAWNVIQSIRKSGIKRKLGYSIEGAYLPLKDLPKASKACVVTNVVLTTKPVNSWAWADMAKALVAGPGSTDSANMHGGEALRMQSLYPNAISSTQHSKKKKRCEHTDEDGKPKCAKSAMEHLIVCCGKSVAVARKTMIEFYSRMAA